MPSHALYDATEAPLSEVVTQRGGLKSRREFVGRVPTLDTRIT